MAYRALHIVHSHHRRGAEVFAAQLATSLEAQGIFENGLCSLYGGDEDGLPTGDLPTFKLEASKGTSDITGAPGLLVRLSQVLRRFQPDIVMAHGGDTMKYAACVSLFYGRGRLVYRNIGTASFWACSPVKVSLNRIFLKKFDAVVSVSQHTRDDFAKVYRFPPERLIYIPNGVDTSAFDAGDCDLTRANVRRELGIPADAMMLVSVGNLSAEKGHRGLLEQMGGFVREGNQRHLVLVGNGPLRQELEQQARRLNLADRVHFLGRRSDVPRLLTAADVFVLSSNTEGMPAVLIEAGLAGLPSVAFGVGGVAEVVEHGISGLLSPDGDYEDLSRHILSFCQDPHLRQRMGISARERCRGLFGMDQVASQYADLFLQVLGAKDHKVKRETLERNSG